MKDLKGGCASMREAGVKSRDVATDDEREADQCEAGVWEGGADVSDGEM